MAIKVYAIWAHPLFRDLAGAIMTHPDIKWVGDSSNIDSAVEELFNLLPNIVLVEDEEALMKTLQRTTAFLDSVKFILMNMEDDRLVLYHQEKRIIKNVEEIQQIILDQ